VGSQLANSYGIAAPYPGFTGTVKQALRPYPQYTQIDTFGGQGDHSGHSTYHSAMIRFEKRYTAGLTFQTSYVFSKLITDADSYWGNGATTGGQGCCLAADQYNRRLEKSIGEYDVTHNFKVGFVYDLPFGKGRQYLTHGPAAWILGNWGVNGVLTYSSGLPVGITSSYILPLYQTQGRSTPYITSYDGWQPAWKNGSFDPSVDNFFVPLCTAASTSCTGPFPAQGLGTNLNGFGNSTRYNPKVREFPNLNENLSVTRSFPVHESVRFEFRAEAFNLLNRVRFGTGSTSLQSQNFGRLTSSADLLNTPRQLQLALKLYF
jgi:hypothetical protein